MNTLTSITRTAAVLGAIALGHVSVGIATVSHASQIDHFQRAAIEMGGHYEKPECLALPYSVWINVQDTDFCVRYYIALGTTKPREAIIYFDGDQGVADGFKIRLSPDWRAQDPGQLQSFANGMRPLHRRHIHLFWTHGPEWIIGASWPSTNAAGGRICQPGARPH